MEKSILSKFGTVIEMPEPFSQPISESKHYSLELDVLKKHVQKNFKLCFQARIMSEDDYEYFLEDKDKDDLVYLSKEIDHTLFFQRVMLSSELNFEYTQSQLSQL